MARVPTTKQARQRRYKKKDKSDRRNAKGWMEGKRQDVFLPLVPSFAEAVDKGWQALEDRLMELQNLYHFHFPWPLKDADEPAELREYDPLHPAPTAEATLSDTELAEKRAHVELYNNVGAPACPTLSGGLTFCTATPSVVPLSGSKTEEARQAVDEA